MVAMVNERWTMGGIGRCVWVRPRLLGLLGLY